MNKYIDKKQFFSFLEFLKSKPDIRTKLIIVAVTLSLVPARNYYYQLDLSSSMPVVRAVDYQLLPPVEYPVNQTQIQPPFLTSLSVMVIDVDSKAILYQKNPDRELLPASITKIMTALISLESYDLNDIVTITNLNNNGQRMDLEIGEQITIENLLYGLLVQSGNDAATALARYYPDGETAFIAAMNQKAEQLHLNNTHFSNPTGLDSPGHYTTVHDLSLLAAEAMTDPVFAKMVGTIGITISNIDNTILHQLETINKLLGEVAGLSGVKTGWTELAGECLVTYTEREQRKIITVVLGSQDRFSDSRQLIDWAFNNHHWQSFPQAIDH